MRKLFIISALCLLTAGSSCDGPLDLFSGPCRSEHGRWDEEWDYWSYRYEYDEWDRLERQVLIYGFGVDQWTDYIYDDAGLLVREETFRDDWLDNFVEHAYDADGALIETGEYGESKYVLKSLTYFHYDGGGRLEHEEYHWAAIFGETTMLTETSYEHDDLGRLAVRRVYGDSTEGHGDYEDDDGMDNVYVYEHDADGVLTDVLVDRDNDDSVDLRWEHAYDGNGFLKEVQVVDFVSGADLERDLYSHDRVGNLLEHERIDRNGEDESFEEYSYACWR